MAKVLGAGGSTNLTGSKFGATLDLLRILSSNIFKADTMLKVHDESDIEFKADLIEAIDAVRKVRTLMSLFRVQFHDTIRTITVDLYNS